MAKRKRTNNDIQNINIRLHILIWRHDDDRLIISEPAREGKTFMIKTNELV